MPNHHEEPADSDKDVEVVPSVCDNENCSRFGVMVFDPDKIFCDECKSELCEVADEEEDIEEVDQYNQWLFDKRDRERPSWWQGDVNRTSRPINDQLIRRPKITPMIVSKPQPSDTFTCSPDLKGCPIFRKAKVNIPIEMFNRWVFLAHEFKTEWIAYLIGRALDETELEYEITDMYFPKQKANGAHCDAIDSPDMIKPNTIAAVHSHVNMNVFFSGEDEAHFNHAIELVVNARGEVAANGRTKLECGRYHRGEAEIVFTNCDAEIDLKNELESKLTKQTWESTNGKGNIKNDLRQVR